MKKLVLAIAVLSLALFVGICSSGCSSDSKPEDFVIEEGVIIRYTGKARNLVIPDGVTAIGEEVFCRTNVRTVTFPDTLTSIGAEAFRGTWIKNIVIPDSVTKIGYKVFFNCDRLVSVTLPDNGLLLGEECFGGCDKLTDMVIPASAEVRSRAVDYTEKMHSIVPSPDRLLPGGLIDNTRVVTLSNMTFTGQNELRLTFIQDAGKMIPVDLAASGGAEIFYRLSLVVRLRMKDGTELAPEREGVLYDAEERLYRYFFYFAASEKPKDVLVNGPKESYVLNGRTFAEYKPWDYEEETGN